MKRQFALWMFFRKKKQGFTTLEAMKACSASRGTVEAYLRALHKAGYMTRERIDGHKVRYVLTKDTGPAAPEIHAGDEIYDPNLAGKVLSARQRVWNILRVARTTGYSELIANAQITETNVRRYLSALVKAGYCNRQRPSGNGKRMPIIFFLIKDTGPLAPEVDSRDTTVFDPNTLETIQLTTEQ